MIVFAHVPKTAGTSVTKILTTSLQQTGVSEQQILLYGEKLPYKDLSPLQGSLDSVRLVAGHLSQEHYEQLLPHKPFVLASNRDPFERFCSWIEHVHRSTKGSALGQSAALTNSLSLLRELLTAEPNHAEIFAALERYKMSAEASGRAPWHVVMHNQSFIADARIESVDVDQFAEKLLRVIPVMVSNGRHLHSITQQNVWPSEVFAGWTPEQKKVLRECFGKCFAEEIAWVQDFRQTVPSVFQDDVWECFVSRLLGSEGNSPPVADSFKKKLPPTRSEHWQMRGCGESQRRRKRVLWLLNHTTLMEWEVPMLLSCGFEVFVPKQLPVGPNGRTAKVTAKFDTSLTIPAADLEYLNNINFYDDPMSRQTARLINRHFGTVISASIFPGLFYLLRAFSGLIFMRAFGHAGAFEYESATATIPRETLDLQSYSTARASFGRLLAHMASYFSKSDRPTHRNCVTAEMFRVRKRLYLAAAYEEIIAHEQPFLKERSVFLPLALPEAMLNGSGGWTGGDDRVFFVCPNIQQIDYYQRIYRDFKEQLGDIPHWIAGRQDLPGAENTFTNDDASVLGYVSREQFDRLLRVCVCMFYHSREPRHLHYHPLEAIVAGLPLIFLSGGLLESLGGADQPGCCRDYAEARCKIQRLRRGDNDLRQMIQNSQQKILQHFEPAYCESIWRQNFLPLVRGSKP